MKNNKFVAALYLILVLLFGACFGWLVLSESQVTLYAPQETVENAEGNDEEITDEHENDEDENVDEHEHSEDEESEEKDEKKPLVVSNPFSFEKINLGLDLAGGVSVVYEAQTEGVPAAEDMQSAVELLRKRLTLNGNTEAEVSMQSDDRIRVEMPGVEDPREAVEQIGQTAQLNFYGISNSNLNIFPTEGGYYIFDLDAEGNVSNIYTGANISEIGELVLAGENISNAYLEFNNSSKVGGTEAVVGLEFDSVGTKAFADATERYINKTIAIVLDDAIISAPTVQSVISDGRAQITGMADSNEATSLANLIKSGSLPFKLEPIETNIIGARLGEDALKTSIKAGLIGFMLVIVFMIIIYNFQGLIASISLSIYLVLVMMTLALFNVTLTLPGIAGIILSVGMAVDANVIIFARIREDLKLGKTVASSIKSGFEKGLSAIVDGNVTTLIIAAILYWKGIGAIRGFAQTLTIGIVLSMFTAIVVTKFLLDLFVNLGINKPIFYGVRKPKEEVTTADLNKTYVKKPRTK